MFNSFRLYTVHVKPGSDLPVFVREGFNWWGFLFTSVWALCNRLWLPAIGLAVYYGAVISLRQHGYLTDDSAFVLIVAMKAFTGLQGNDWIRHRLTEHGYITTNVVAGDSRLRAQQRYFEQAASPSGA